MAVRSVSEVRGERYRDWSLLIPLPTPFQSIVTDHTNLALVGRGGLVIGDQHGPISFIPRSPPMGQAMVVQHHYIALLVVIDPSVPTDDLADMHRLLPQQLTLVICVESVGTVMVADGFAALDPDMKEQSHEGRFL